MSTTKIRGPIWETNSSSSHTIVTGTCESWDSMEGLIRAYKGKDLTIHLDGEHGWGPDNVWGFEGKLEYLCQDLGEPEKVQAFLEPLLKGLLEIESFHVISGGGYIDHQSVGTANQHVRIKEKLNPMKIISFLMDDNTYIHIDNDYG